jgi:uncharacterized protein YbcI
MSSRTQGEVEAQIGSAFSKFYSELFSRGPKHIEVNMLPTAAVIITQNSFTLAEKKMMIPEGLHDESGQQIFKAMRARIISANKDELTKIIEAATNVAVTCLHHDMSPITGEESFVFSLQDKPSYRVSHNGYTKKSFIRSHK